MILNTDDIRSTVLIASVDQLNRMLYWALAKAKSSEMNSMKRRKRGEAVVLRWVDYTGGFWGSFPMTVVEDSDDLLTLYFPPALYIGLCLRHRVKGRLPGLRPPTPCLAQGNTTTLATLGP